MFPGNQWSSEPVPQTIRPPKDYIKGNKQPQDVGPVAIGDNSEGIDAYLWALSADGDDVFITREGQTPVFLFSAAGASSFDVAFDTAGNPFVAYEHADGIYIYWYDPQEQGQRLTLRAPGGKNPFCSLDVREPERASESDIILLYERDDAVYYRLTRDRYTVEYPTPATALGGRSIVWAGVGNEFRYTFAVEPE